MSERQVLDTSAILAYFEDEDGADLVAEALLGAARGERSVSVSFVSLTELQYILIQERDSASADRALAVVRSWPVDIVHSTDAVCRQAAVFKAAHRISLADAFVAATAKLRNAALIHKDPEFEALSGDIGLIPLPYK